MSSFTERFVYEDTGHTNGNGSKIYEIKEEFSYHIGDYERPLAIVCVPVGYYTDFASIPKFSQFLFKPDGPWAKAAVVHDFLYMEVKDVSKVVKDSIFLEAMLVSNVNTIIAHIFFFAVRIYQSFKKD